MNDSSQRPGARSGTTHFGFRDVPTADKQKLVGEVFSSVAGKYDLMNDLMSLGIHRVWKRYFVGTCQVKRGDRVLDLAGGTGDIALLLRDRVGDTGSIVLGDINGAMLRVGRDRMTDMGKVAGLEYVQMQRREAAVPGWQFRPGHHRLRPAQRHRQGRRAARDEPCAQGGRPGARAGVLGSEDGLVQADLRLPFLQGAAAPGQAVRQRCRQLPVPGREHPQASAAGRTEGDDAGGGFRAVRLSSNLSAGIVAIHTGYKV